MAATQTAKVQRAEDAKRQDAYLAIQQQYAKVADQNAIANQFFMQEKMNEVKTQKLNRTFASKWLPELSIKSSPLTFEDGFWKDTVSVNGEDENVYLTKDKEDDMWKSYSNEAKALGVQPDRLQFKQMFKSLQGRQAEDINRSLIEMRSKTGMDIDKMNKAMANSQARNVLDQVLINGADPMQSGYVPQMAGGGNDGFDFWQLGGVAALGARATSLAKAGYAGQSVAGVLPARAGQKLLASTTKAGRNMSLPLANTATGGVRGAVGNLAGSSTKAKLSAFIAKAATEEGRTSLMKLAEKKYGPKVAHKLAITLASKMGGAVASNAIPLIGQALSAGITAYTAYELYGLIEDMLD
jgi:hypothetical protein